MKPVLTILTVLLFLLLFRTYACSQTAARLWSLDDCIEYALNNNIQINALRLDYRSAQEDLQQSRALKFPDLSGAVTQTAINRKNVYRMDGSQTPQKFSSGYSVNSSLTLYNGGYITHDIRSKELSLQSAELYVQQTANDITLNLTRAYLDILLAKENIVYLKEVLATSEAQLKQGQQRFDAGAISRKDFLQFQSQVAADEYNLVNANNNYRQNIVTLKQILQLPSAEDFQIAMPDTLMVMKAIPSLAEAQKAAQQSRAEVKNGEIAIQVAQMELLKARAGLKPLITAGASLSSAYGDNQNYKYFSQLNNNFYQSLGLTISIPIYNQRINRTNIEKSKILVLQEQLALLNTRTVLDQQVEQVYISLQNAQAQYSAAQAQLRATEEIYRITNEQLRLGAMNMVELLQQKTLYVAAMQSFIQAKYTLILYNKIYDYYMGNPMSL